MTDKKNLIGNIVPISLANGIVVNVLPNEIHEYLITTRDVAIGYGVSKYTVLRTIQQNGLELVEGQHFVSGSEIITPSLKGIIQHNSILITKQGVVKLGDFVKSNYSKMFSEWASELTINPESLLAKSELPVSEVPVKKTIKKELTPHEIIDIMADVCLIDDRELRLSITKKLLGGHV